MVPAYDGALGHALCAYFWLSYMLESDSVVLRCTLCAKLLSFSYATVCLLWARSVPSFRRLYAFFLKSAFAIEWCRRQWLAHARYAHYVLSGKWFVVQSTVPSWGHVLPVVCDGK